MDNTDNMEFDERDLYHEKFDIDRIVWNIKHNCIDLRQIVRTQILTPYVCAKYVVFGGRDEQYATCSEDAWVATGDVLRYQPHITEAEMMKAHMIADEEDEQETEIENMSGEDKYYCHLAKKQRRRLFFKNDK